MSKSTVRLLIVGTFVLGLLIGVVSAAALVNNQSISSVFAPTPTPNAELAALKNDYNIEPNVVDPECVQPFKVNAYKWTSGSDMVTWVSTKDPNLTEDAKRAAENLKSYISSGDLSVIQDDRSEVNISISQVHDALFKDLCGGVATTAIFTGESANSSEDGMTYRQVVVNLSTDLFSTNAILYVFGIKGDDLFLLSTELLPDNEYAFTGIASKCGFGPSGSNIADAETKCFVAQRAKEYKQLFSADLAFQTNRLIENFAPVLP